jgi:predicted DNA-binding protein
VPFTCRLPAGLDQRLNEAAKKHSIPKAVLVEKIIREWLEREKLWAEKGVVHGDQDR